MNDPDATQAQVTDTLRDIAEGILPLAVVTIATIIGAAILGDQDE